MCGIVGIITKSANDERSLRAVQEAIQALKKRGPDQDGILQLEKITLGHTRLAVIDLSESANQPLHDQSNRYTIVFNGEIYNYQSFRKELEEEFTFKSNSDTEIILYLYIKYGEKCVSMLNGFFAFAIYDKEKQTCFIARDRIGIKPLYFHAHDEFFAFGSELKAVNKLKVKQEIDQVSLFFYFLFNYIPGPETIFREVKKLAPGHCGLIDFSGGSIVFEQNRYYDIPLVADNPVNLSSDSYLTAQKKVEELLYQSVEKRLISDVPIGTFLSGGIDSTIVTGIASTIIPQLNTFSLGYKDNPVYDESIYAELVAKEFGTNHHRFDFQMDDLLSIVDEVLDYIDEPFADSSAIAVYLLSKKTREHVTVALSGDGADELFSGYNKHMAEYKALHPGISGNFVRLTGGLWRNLPQSRSTLIGNKIRQLDKFSSGISMSNKERYWTWACMLPAEHANYLLKEKMVFNEQRLSDDGYQYKKRKDEILKFIKKDNDFNAVLRTDLHLVLPNDMLTKVDLMSMANSLEVRTPFLDHHLVDYVSSLPAAYKINASMKKKILQDSFKEMLPAQIYNRPKHGFEVPLLSWFKNELKERVDSVVFNEEFISAQNIFNLQAIKEIKEQLYSNSPGNAPTTTWALLVFQSWWKKNLA